MRKLFSIFLLYFLCVVIGGVLDSCQKTEKTRTDDWDCVMIVPDIQNYTDRIERFVYLDSICGWYNNHIGKVQACFQVGDITNNNGIDQWKNADEQFFSRLYNKPIFCLGNHDYGVGGTSLDRTSNVPEHLFPTKDIYESGSQYENYVHFVRIGLRSFGILVLEIAPRNEILSWANKVIKEYADTPFIILTHIFLNNQGQLFDSQDSNCDQTYSPKSLILGGEYLNDSMEVFNKIIYDNDNVKMVICGHCTSKQYVEYMAKPNKNGSPVHFIMVNFQEYEDGGKGNVGLLYIQDTECFLRTYSTYSHVFGNYEKGFTLRF